MRTNDLERSLASLFTELVYGAPSDGAYALNPGDEGLLRALDALSAEDASASRLGGGAIAAHVDHLTYGLSLLNRWAEGENPFGDTDYAASWKRSAVDEAEWLELRSRLRREAERWREALGQPREVSGIELDGVIGSIIHLAYHFGAIRQIAPATRGPRAAD